jgi:heat shock protein HslJ
MKNLLIGLIIISGFCCSPKLSPDYNWQNRKWVLVELKQVPVQLSGSRRDAFIEFFPDEKRFTGNGGCNSINGLYEINRKKSEIGFSNIVSTKISCPDIAFENTFLETLDKVNRYEVSGNTILLKDENHVLLIVKEQ